MEGQKLPPAPRRSRRGVLSEISVGGRGGLVGPVFHRRFCIPDGLLDVALQLLSGAFCLQFVRSDR